LEFASLKKLVSYIQDQTDLQGQYNHKVIHVILSLSNAASPAAPGYITQLLLEVNTRAIKNGRKQPRNFYTSATGTPGAPGAQTILRIGSKKKWQKASEFGACDFIYQLGAQRARARVIHRLSPAAICRWSFGVCI